ncbi:MAG: TRAP transporter small permease [Oceanobacter sp.]
MSLANWLADHYEEKGPVAWLAFFLEAFAALILMALMFLTCADVLGRYLFDNAVDGSVELTELAIALIVFAEMPVITWRGTHVIVDILDKWLGKTLVFILSVVSSLLISASLYFLAARMMKQAERSIRRNVVTEYLEMPVGYIVEYIAVMSYATAALMITYGLYRLYREHTQ